jgi:cysteine desulfurase
LIYLDYNATTPVDPEVLDAMLPYLRDRFGNPSSAHPYGVRAKEAVEEARGQVAELLGCSPDEIIFTGGGSESDNHALKGAAYALRDKGNHIITSLVEHPAVLNTCKSLERNGCRVTYLPVDSFGMVDPRDVRNAITKQTILITIMHANNEVGTIEPIEQIGGIARSRGILFHTDAAQSVGKIPVRVEDLNADLLTVAGHKFYAPKGVGALFIRRGLSIEPLIHGAGHEKARRAGTENVAGIVGIGKAAEIASSTMDESSRRILALRERLHRGIIKRVQDVKLNGHPEKRLPNTLNLSFRGLDGASFLERMSEVAASLGSACHDTSRELSPVLEAMGVGEEYGFGAVRFSLGRFTTEEEIERAVEIIAENVRVYSTK